MQCSDNCKISLGCKTSKTTDNWYSLIMLLHEGEQFFCCYLLVTKRPAAPTIYSIKFLVFNL